MKLDRDWSKRREWTVEKKPKENSCQIYPPITQGRDEIGEFICPHSRTIHCSFVRNGKYSERGWACTVHTPPPPAWANFSIMMKCMPESGRCHSVCTLWIYPSYLLTFIYNQTQDRLWHSKVFTVVK
jgi:hypothetical protein